MQPLLSTDLSANGGGKWGLDPGHYQWLITRMTLWSVALATSMYRSVPFGGVTALTRGTKYLLACAWYESARGSSLVSGMMLEQASLCTLSVPNFGSEIALQNGSTNISKISLRKAGHQMIQAGHRYLEHGLVAHALHCYAAVAPLYEEGWSKVDTHVQHSMATQLAAVGATKEASATLLQLVAKCHPTDPTVPPHLLLSSLHPRVQGIMMMDLFRKGCVIYTITVERLEETTANIFKTKIINNNFFHNYCN